MSSASDNNIGGTGDDGTDGADGKDHIHLPGVAGVDGTVGFNGDDITTTIAGTIGDPSDPVTIYHLTDAGGDGGFGGYGGNGGTGTPGADAGHGGSGGSGGAGDVGMLAVQLDLLDLTVTGGDGGDGGSGGNGGDGKAGTDIPAPTTGGNGGDGGDAGNGGDATATLYGALVDSISVLVKGGDGGIGGNIPFLDAGAGEGGGLTGSGHFGLGGHGGKGGDGGNGGDATLSVAGGVFSLTASSAEFAAVGGDGDGGGAGGRSYDTFDNGAMGASGSGGDAAVDVNGAAFSFNTSVVLIAMGGDGAGGVLASYVTQFVGGTSAPSENGAAGNGGNAYVNLQNSTFTGGGGDEVLGLDFELSTGQSRMLGDLNGHASTVQGAAGVGALVFDGNTIDGGGGDDTLVLSGLTYADNDAVPFGAAHKDHEIYTVSVDLTTGQLDVGTGVNTIINVVNVDLSEQTTYPFDALDKHDYATDAYLRGDSNDNILTASQGNDELHGEDGADILDGWLGADTMYGGDGDDTYYVDNAGDQAIENDGEGHDTVYATVTYTIGDHVEDLALIGNGNVNGTGNDQDNTLTGNDGKNWLYGLGGNDYFDGGAGINNFYGGGGDDTYIVATVHDHVHEDTVSGVDDGGTDTVVTSMTYTLGDFIENLTLTGTTYINGTGNDLNNTLTGSDGYNKLYGMDGDDYLYGGAGVNNLYGGAGDDTYVVATIHDHVHEDMTPGVDDGGTDTVLSYISYTLDNFVENLTLMGGDDINGTGSEMGNVIIGNSGINKIDGKSGDDTIAGGAGNDILTGSFGADTFVFAAAGADNGIDHIKDFVSGTDHLSFSSSDYGGMTAATLILTLTGTAVGTDAQFVYKASNHTLYWDDNGHASGGMTAIMVFSNGAAPAAGDFIFT